METKEYCITTCPDCQHEFTEQEPERAEFYQNGLDNLQIIFQRTCPKCNKTWYCQNFYLRRARSSILDKNPIAQ